MKSDALSLVIPVYNETDNIAPLLQDIENALHGKTYEVIYVDDGSSDDTLARLQTLQKTQANLRVLAHQGRFGQSAAIVTGILAARYDWIVTLDGDGQNDPSDIPRLLEKAQENPEQACMVLGLRAKRNDNLLRRFSSRVANHTRRFLLQDDCPDTGCSLKLFPRDIFLRFPHFNHLHRFLPALAKRQGLAIRFVPVNHRPRLGGVSKYGVWNRLWVGIVDLMGVMWLIRRPCRPLAKELSVNTL